MSVPKHSTLTNITNLITILIKSVCCMIFFIYYPLTAYDIQYQVTSSDQSATRLRDRETLHMKT